VYFPSKSFGQERYYYGPPGHVSLELGAKYLGRGITEDGFTFNNTQYPKTDAWATSTQLLAKLAIDFTPNFQIYGIGGGSTLHIDEFDGYSADVLIPQENWNGLAFGGGIKITLYPETFHAPVKLFLDLSYLQFKTEDMITFHPNNELVNEQIRWDQYVGKIGLSGRYGFVENYGGIRVSFVRGKDHIPTSTQTLDLKFTEDIPVGIFFGWDIYLDRGMHTALFIEASLIDENSIAGGMKFGF
jgi:hypothetical protein